MTAGSRTAPLAVAGAAICSVWLYRPWQAFPFELPDFSENLWLLRPPSLLGKWDAFIHFYSAQGRWDPVVLARWIAEWSLFGAHVIRWQLAAFVLMSLVVAGTFFLLRRLIGSSLGAAAGAAMYLVAAPVVPGWNKLMLGEPLGLLFLLGAGLLATRYTTTVHWRRDGLLIALLLSLALLTKEMCGAALPFIAVIACCLEEPGRLRAPRLDRRTIYGLALGLFATALTLAPAAVVALRAPPGAYVAAYGAGGLDPRRALSEFAAMMLPVPPHSMREPMLGFVPNTLYVAILGASILAAARRAGWQLRRLTQDLAMVGLALSLPLCATLAYLPLAYWEPYYALPFYLGSTLLLAWAAATLARLAPRSLATAGAAYAIVFLCALASAQLAARATAATHEVVGQLTEYLGLHASGRLVLETAPAAVLAGEGPFQRRSLGRYIMAVYPAAKPLGFGHATCVSAPSPSAEGNPPAIFVTFSNICGGFTRPTAIFRRVFRYVAWQTCTVEEDSVRAEVWARP
jgi:hypothetical protein